MNKKRLNNIIIVFISCFIIYILSACQHNSLMQNLNDRNELMIAISGYNEEDFYYTEEKKIIDLLANSIDVDVKVRFFSDSDEALSQLKEKKIDIAIGNFSQSTVLEQEYDLSFVYDNKFLYCVTKNPNYLGSIEYIDISKTFASQAIPNDKVYALLDTLEGVVLEDDSVTQVVEALNDKDVIKENYVCYRDKAIRVASIGNDIYIHKITDVEPINLVVVINKNKSGLIELVNKMIIEYKAGK